MQVLMYFSTNSAMCDVRRVVSPYFNHSPGWQVGREWPKGALTGDQLEKMVLEYRDACSWGLKVAIDLLQFDIWANPEESAPDGVL